MSMLHRRKRRHDYREKKSDVNRGGAVGRGKRTEMVVRWMLE